MGISERLTPRRSGLHLAGFALVVAAFFWVLFVNDPQVHNRTDWIAASLHMNRLAVWVIVAVLVGSGLLIGGLRLISRSGVSTTAGESTRRRS